MPPLPRTESLPNGTHRGVATIDGRRRTKVWPTQGEALVWADTEMRKAARDAAARDTGRSRPQDGPHESRDGAALTLADYVPVFLAARVLEPSTVTTYRSNLAPAVEEFGSRPLGAIERDDVIRWVTDMTRRRGRSRVKLGTVKARLKALRMLYTEATRAGVVSSDPTAGIPLPAAPEMPFRIIEDDEEDALLEAAAANGILVPVLLAIDAGLRWAEVYGQHASNINVLRRKLTVSDVLARPNFEPRPYPKGKRIRTIPMTARLSDALSLHLEEGARGDQRDGMIRCPDRACRNGMLLFSHQARPVNYHQWKAAFQRTVKAADLEPPEPTFHKLRHTFGTRLARAGVPAQEIAALMGHRSTDTTEIYVHVAAPSTREAWLRHALEGAPSPLAALVPDADAERGRATG